MPNGLNENHARVLVTTLAHIDSLLRNALATASGMPSPFSEVAPDLDKVEIDVVTQYLLQGRAELVDAARALGLSVPAARTTSSSAIQVAVTFADIALQDVAPKRLRGYGELAADASVRVERVEDSLARTLQRIRAFLGSRRGAADLASRLERLEGTPFDSNLLRRLHDVTTRHRFVELRPAIESLIERAEVQTFEIAFFGRVSSGKSSLLNAILGSAVLPVGVTPVTAVPIRIVWGEPAAATIQYADRPAEEVAIARLEAFISEAGNPRNQKHVVHAMVRLPAAALRAGAGVAFVDTPGVGSLATSGARETFTYLPRCDLGVLLIAAGGTIEQEDLMLVRLLREAGIPASVIISKCDLLDESERVTLREYVRAKISGVVGVDVPAHAVSAVGSNATLAQSWFQDQLAPMLANARALGEASARRKLGALKEQVVALLEAKLGRGGRDHAEELEAAIQETVFAAEGAVGEARRQWEAVLECTTTDPGPVLAAAISGISAQIERRELVDVEVALAAALHALADRAQTELRAILIAARARLVALLTDTSSVLPHISPPERLAVDMLAMPELHLPAAMESIPKRRARWSERLAPLRKHQLMTELTQHCGREVQEALRTWGRELQAWAAQVLDQLAQQLRARVDPLRAQVRLLVSGEIQADEAREVAADLSAIEELSSS